MEHELLARAVAGHNRQPWALLRPPLHVAAWTLAQSVHPAQSMMPWLITAVFSALSLRGRGARGRNGGGMLWLTTAGSGGALAGTWGPQAEWGEHEMDYILFIKADVTLAPNTEEVMVSRRSRCRCPTAAWPRSLLHAC